MAKIIVHYTIGKTANVDRFDYGDGELESDIGAGVIRFPNGATDKRGRRVLAAQYRKAWRVITYDES